MFKKLYQHWNVLVITQGPKAGRLFAVPSVPRKTGRRPLKLRNAQWLLNNSNFEYTCGYIQGYLSGVAGFFPELKK